MSDKISPTGPASWRLRVARAASPEKAKCKAISSAKIVVLGLDGATFDLILPWVQVGKLPHLARLLSRGIAGTLRSTMPPMSPPAWNSFMTGTNPGKRGIYDFTGRTSHSYETHFINASWRRAPTLWHHLSRGGKRVAVLSVPFTYPPE
jgi:predicted AlkP superfamily phosphohydrolase/phosphomutase